MGNVVRVAFRFIEGDVWQGGYNYLLNLCSAIVNNSDGTIQPVLFYWDGISDAELEPFVGLLGENCLLSPAMEPSSLKRRAIGALITGHDKVSSRVFLKAGIDVVFENADFYGKKFPIPVVSWIPDFQHRYLRHLFTKRQFVQRELGFRAQVYSDRQIMVSSEDSKKDCLNFYNIDAERVNVVSFSIPFNTKLQSDTCHTVVSEYELPANFFFLPNTFWPHKNHEVVVDAIAYLRNLGSEVVVAVSGKGNHPSCIETFEKVKARVEELGLEQSFRMLNHIPYDHVRALMMSCRALINPSKFEGWSTTIEEAKSYGVDLILSDIPVNREQVEEAGHYFAVDDYIKLADHLLNIQSKAS